MDIFYWGLNLALLKIHGHTDLCPVRNDATKSSSSPNIWLLYSLIQIFFQSQNHFQFSLVRSPAIFSSFEVLVHLPPVHEYIKDSSFFSSDRVRLYTYQTFDEIEVSFLSFNILIIVVLALV